MALQRNTKTVNYSTTELPKLTKLSNNNHPENSLNIKTNSTKNKASTLVGNEDSTADQLTTDTNNCEKLDISSTDEPIPGTSEAIVSTSQPICQNCLQCICKS